MPGLPLLEMINTTISVKDASRSTEPSLYLIVSQTAIKIVMQSTDLAISLKTMWYMNKISYVTQGLSSPGSYILTTSTNMVRYWSKPSSWNGPACNYHDPISFGRCTWN